MMQVTATKKFSEYDLTSVYADMTYIDEATQNLLYDWFQFRTVCDDERFPIFFRRKLMRCEVQYHQLLSLEHRDFDPLVATYRERLTTDDYRHNGTNGNTTIDSRSKTAEESKVSSETSHSEGSFENIDKQASKANPSSIAYVNPGTGKLPVYDWSYMNGQGQTEGVGNSENDVTSSQSENNESSEIISGSSSVSGSSSASDKRQVEEIYTGRDGLTPQEAYLKAKSWIIVSDAFDWLKGELNDCFLGIIEV